MYSYDFHASSIYLLPHIMTTKDTMKPQCTHYLILKVFDRQHDIIATGKTASLHTDQDSSNNNNQSTPLREHKVLALCHLAEESVTIRMTCYMGTE
jgi:hypothetical protein